MQATYIFNITISFQDLHIENQHIFERRMFFFPVYNVLHSTNEHQMLYQICIDFLPTKFVTNNFAEFAFDRLG